MLPAESIAESIVQEWGLILPVRPPVVDWATADTAPLLLVHAPASDIALICKANEPIKAVTSSPARDLLEERAVFLLQVMSFSLYATN